MHVGRASIEPASNPPSNVGVQNVEVQTVELTRIDPPSRMELYARRRAALREVFELSTLLGEKAVVRLTLGVKR